MPKKQFKVINNITGSNKQCLISKKLGSELYQLLRFSKKNDPAVKNSDMCKKLKGLSGTMRKDELVMT